MTTLRRRKTRWFWALGVVGVFTLAGILASLPWCARRRASPPVLLRRGFARGPLSAGAARVAVPLRFPLVLGGYTLPRPEVTSAPLPLEARALVLEVGTVSVGLVTLDILLMPEALAEEVRAGASGLGLSEVFVTVTHVHSSAGGYDPRLFAELGGTSRFRADIHEALRASMVRALTEAAKKVAPVALRRGAGDVDLTVSRRGVPGRDTRLDRFSFLGAAGVVGELDVFAAHATLAPRNSPVLDTDYVGRLARLEWDAGHGVMVLLQGAEGNLAPRPSSRAEPLTATFAMDVSRALGSLEPTPLEPSLGFARVTSTLPSPDASRLLPRLAWRWGQNLLCELGPSAATVSVLELGGVRMVLVPGEPTYETAKALETAARAVRTVALADGYLGYLEPAERVRAVQGESRMQYFGPALVEVLARDAAAAGDALDAAKTRP